MSDSPFDAAVALEPSGPGRFIGQTHAAYANFVGPFGGITAAQCMNSVLRHPELLGEPVALTVNFAAAVADGAFELFARPARTNRSTQHWIVEMRQGDSTVTTATVVTARRRATFEIPEAAMPIVPAPAEVAVGGGARRVGWTNRYEMRVIEGPMPKDWNGADAGHSRSRLWMRDMPPRPLDYLSLTALSDVFFPRIWRRRATFTPLGTVTMSTYFHVGEAQLRQTGSGFLLGQAQGQGFHANFFDQSAQMWNEAGVLLATTHQVMYFKE